MCTCISINSYFGRNMDITHSFNERIIITPRNYIINYKVESPSIVHYAIIGIGNVTNNYPLYADAINEHGLGVAALNFPYFSYYHKQNKDKINLAPYELILYILSNFKNVKEVKEKINLINLVNINFSMNLKNTPLHYMVSDNIESIVIESTKNGINIYNNPFNILTNSPPFSYHKENIKNYLNLHNKDSINVINKSLKLNPISFGLGAFGLPGDYSSTSRFIKGFFIKSFLDFNKDEYYNIIQFYNCLDSIKMIKGCVYTKHGYEYTRYTSIYNLSKGILYYKTYDDYRIYSMNLFNNNLNNNELIIYEFNIDSKIK